MAKDFSTFVSQDLVLRPSQRVTIPAPTTTQAAVESERMLSAALRCDTARAPAMHATAVLTDLEWE
jgi:hypothetical protein